MKIYPRLSVIAALLVFLYCFLYKGATAQLVSGAALAVLLVLRLMAVRAVGKEKKGE